MQCMLNQGKGGKNINIYIYHSGIIRDDESIERRTVGRKDEGGRAGSGRGQKASASRSFSSSSLWRPQLGLQAASAPPPLLVSLSLISSPSTLVSCFLLTPLTESFYISRSHCSPSLLWGLIYSVAAGICCPRFPAAFLALC